MSKVVPTTQLTIKDFYTKLSERVSTYNARLLIQSALIGSGLHDTEESSPLNENDAETLCLELIKKGGPAFQVGKAMYSSFKQ